MTLFSAYNAYKVKQYPPNPPPASQPASQQHLLPNNRPSGDVAPAGNGTGVVVVPGNGLVYVASFSSTRSDGWADRPLSGFKIVWFRTGIVHMHAQYLLPGHIERQSATLTIYLFILCPATPVSVARAIHTYIQTFTHTKRTRPEHKSNYKGCG